MRLFRPFLLCLIAMVTLLVMPGTAGAAAATLTVNGGGDTNARDGVLTLREAILLATGTLTAGTLDSGECDQISNRTYTPPCSTTDTIGAASADTVVVPAGTITLVAVLPTLGTGNDTISGAGPASSIVDGVTKAFNCFVITGEGSDGNKISGLQIKRCADGVRIESGADDNTIGGTTAAERNVISGNGSDGIEIRDGTTTGNAVMGNFIGTDVTGTADLGNSGRGVYVYEAPANFIGGTEPGARNLIAGNTGSGVFILGAGATGNQVQGNFIGTEVSGTAALGNGIGVEVSNAPANTVGGTTGMARNVISGNSGFGVSVFGTANVVQGNFIGTDVTGSASLGNGTGVRVSGVDNTVGGVTPGAGNVISGNGDLLGDGLDVVNASGTQMQGNFIGTNANGTAALPNARDGVYMYGGPNNTIGGATAGAGNVISGNGDNGVNMAFAHANQVWGNFIGTDVAGTAALGNSNHGILLQDDFLGDPQNNTIGGVVSGEANTIAFNGNDGVRVDGSSATGDAIRGNSIHSNGGKGIENINGGNGNLAPPVITAVGSASGTTCANCTVDVYSDSVDEGRIYHGWTAADGGGNWNYPGAVTGPNITATATNASGNTSEFGLFDTDGDGVGNGTDNCPSAANPGQQNNVHPGTTLGDHCEDPEPDGVFDISDNCPDTANSGQENAVHPGTTAGDHCEDPEPDGVFDISDNCPDIANSGQENVDGDAQGDACDADDDNDGLLDGVDPCPLDHDCDDDGYWDKRETDKGSVVLDAASTPEHCDGVDNDGDTVLDEAPALSGRAFPDPLCAAGADPDGDTIVNSADPDDDNDGFTDVREQYMTTDELDDCRVVSGHDAWPPDANSDGQAFGNDVIILFLGKVLNPPNYDARADANGDGLILGNDVVILFLGRVFTSCA